MNQSTLPYWLSLMVVLTASYMGWRWYQVRQFEEKRSIGGIEFSGPPLKEFELTERSGETFRSADMKGKVWVTTFFFANCQGTCSKLNANIKYLSSLEELQDVTWVSITVDPGNDTLEVLNEYADQRSADPERWLFCRADFSYTKRVGKDFLKLPVMWKDHSDVAAVIDKTGKIRGYFDALSTKETKRMTKLLVECLAETVPAENHSGVEADEEQTEATAEPLEPIST